MGNTASGNIFDKQFQSQISQNPLIIYSKSNCGYCTKSRQLLDKENIPYNCLDLDKIEGGMDMFKSVNAVTRSRFVPQIFICGQYIGGYDELLDLQQTGTLKAKLCPCSPQFCETTKAKFRYGI